MVQHRARQYRGENGREEHRDWEKQRGIADSLLKVNVPLKVTYGIYWNRLWAEIQSYLADKTTQVHTSWLITFQNHRWKLKARRYSV